MNRLLRLSVIAIACASPMTAMALPCDAMSDPRAILSALNSTDVVALETAKVCGLSSADKPVRVITLAKLIKGASAIAVQIDNFEGDADAARFIARLPTFGIDHVQWSPEGGSFRAWHHNFSDGAHGNLLGETMSVDYERVYVTASDGRSSAQTCSLSMTLTTRRDALEGSMRCSGLPYRFRARLGL